MIQFTTAGGINYSVSLDEDRLKIIARDKIGRELRMLPENQSNTTYWLKAYPLHPSREEKEAVFKRGLRETL